MSESQSTTTTMTTLSIKSHKNEELNSPPAKCHEQEFDLLSAKVQGHKLDVPPIKCQGQELDLPPAMCQGHDFNEQNNSLDVATKYTNGKSAAAASVTPPTHTYQQ